MSQTSIDVYNPGHDITGRAATKVEASRFLAITGNSASGVLTVGHAVAGGRVAGVAKYGAEAGELVGLARGNSRVVRVVAASSIAAFGDVEVGPDAKAVPATTGKVVGYAITSATAGSLAAISLA
ncbi:DUF2190 domain-containing protein [Rhodococcus erythropolis]|uniref:DUF2190 domain-containing protein n=1 Tax=Rhodococcus erythropolis TaxID=1833 RepID=UPI0037B18F72